MRKLTQHRRTNRTLSLVGERGWLVLGPQAQGRYAYPTVTQEKEKERQPQEKETKRTEKKRIEKKDQFKKGKRKTHQLHTAKVPLTFQEPMLSRDLDCRGSEIRGCSHQSSRR